MSNKRKLRQYDLVQMGDSRWIAYDYTTETSATAVSPSAALTEVMDEGRPIETEVISKQELDEAYTDRNSLACALARSTDAESGWKPDPESPDDRAIVWIETPYGQISWHVPQGFAASSGLPLDESDYDGYDCNTKNTRLWKWVEKGCLDDE